MTWKNTTSDNSLQPTDYKATPQSERSERPHSSSTEGAYLITIPGWPRFARHDAINDYLLVSGY